jgi:hypothetical protein
VSDFLDRYHRQLVTAAGQVLPRPAPSTRFRWRRGQRALIVALAALLVSSAAVAATGSWRGVLGVSDEATLTTAPPPSSELAILGVLRRAQTAQDYGPLTRDALQYFGASPNGLRPGFIRLLAVNADGEGIVLVPAVAYDPAFLNDSPSLRAQLAKTSPVCVFYPDPLATGGVRNCWDQHDVEAGRATASLGLDQYGLVPDGVASVLLTYRHGLHAEGTVRDNFFDVAAPREPADPEVTPRQPTTIVWRTDDGRVVATWPQP